MARDLSKGVAEHDDANSLKHQIDKAAAAERKKTHYEPEPAVATVAGSSIVDGVFRSPIKGFSYRLKAGVAVKASDPKAYTKEVLEMSRKRARYARTRVRDGKTRKDYGQYKHGAVSLVTTLPPWAVKTVSRIGPFELEDLMLRLAEAQSQRIEEISGRPTFGGGCRLDTAIPHWHSHIMKTDADGNVYPKATFHTAGPWLTGAARIERKFPGLLSQYKRERMEKHMARKKNLVDVAACEALDTALESWIRERGLWRDYERDCAEYEKRKIKAQKEEPQKRIVQSALGYHARTGVWPLAYKTMTWGMWKMIPKELRMAITVSIKGYQLIRNPVRLITVGPGLVLDAVREPQVTLPRK